jgi:phospho-N-acetylmuramoyl-pentapeptide-transferase
MTAVTIPVLVLTDITRAGPAAVMLTALACAAIGFADDWIKIVRKRSLGLPGRWKLFWQAVIAAGLWYVASERAGLGHVMLIRVFDASIDLGPFYPVLIFLALAGATNGVNLTDGLDGLAAGCAAIVFTTYTFMTGNGHQTDLTLISACFAAACIGFLWFNSFPAAIFMGDTGSLGLGGAIAALAVMTHTEVLLILIGGIFVIEALSVAIQVFSFRMFRRRVFLMAPIHHDFEMRGWSETKIILRFWIVAAGFAAVGFVLFLNPL